jgi:hypothetical protein
MGSRQVVGTGRRIDRQRLGPGRVGLAGHAQQCLGGDLSLGARSSVIGEVHGDCPCPTQHGKPGASTAMPRHGRWPVCRRCWLNIISSETTHAWVRVHRPTRPAWKSTGRVR